MYSVMGTPTMAGNIFWTFWPHRQWEEVGLKVGFHLTAYSEKFQRRQAFKAVEGAIASAGVNWLTPGPREWAVNLDELKKQFTELSELTWLTGTVTVEPEFETYEREVFDRVSYEAAVVFYLTPGEMHHMKGEPEIPIEIRESLSKFRLDHPNPTKAAFLMMQFGKTKAHEGIVEAVRSALATCGISALRADDKQYHDDLFPNVLTYIYGCGFGAAIFERLEADQFNPNVSLEVGYMFALRKPTCLLKDKTLKTLPTDLVGKIYRSFDPQDPTGTIPKELKQWMADKGIA